MRSNVKIATALKNDLELVENNNTLTPVVWLEDNRSVLQHILYTKGAILLRGFKITAVSEFSQFATTFSPELLDYENRSTPRTKLGGKIYTSTEYPEDQVIPQHNENAYTNKWPNTLLFFCVVPSEIGGETPLSDSREFLNLLDADIVKRFEEQGVLYVRHYMPGVDLSWQDVFQTGSREEVGKFCDKNGINFYWHDDDHLETRQVCQATHYHPVTKEKVWFNQAHLFHISAGGQERKNMLLKEFGPKNLPRNAYFADGSEIPDDMIAKITDAYCQNLIKFSWRKGDILLLDNVLKTHGRMPYKGARKIAVAMA